MEMGFIAIIGVALISLVTLGAIAEGNKSHCIESYANSTRSAEEIVKLCN